MRKFWPTKDNRIAITGAGGLIGSTLANTLHRQGYKVLAIDNFEKGRREALDEGIEIRQIDLRVLYTKSPLFRGYSTVIHLASKVGGIGYYTDNPYEVLRQNILIDSNTLDCAIENKVRNYFYASSAHIYSKLKGLIKEEDGKNTSPILSYGWAKLLGEKQLQCAIEEGKIKGAIARYIGIYGEGQVFDLDVGSVIPVLCHRAVRYPELPFTLWGTGKETRTYCYIEDAIDATMRMIGRLYVDDIVGPLNIGGEPTPISIENIAKEIIQISGKDITINYDTSKETVLWEQTCDCSAAYKLLHGWKATTSLNEGLQRIYKDVERRLQHTPQEYSR
tara:strand:- start:14093 stop:15094 length:1002 start_codon:yes stop_codon:yes gene_type:complete